MANANEDDAIWREIDGKWYYFVVSVNKNTLDAHYSINGRPATFGDIMGLFKRIK